MTEPRQGWHEAYLTLKYQPRKFDCLDFVVKVQREVFGRTVKIPPPRLPQPVADNDYRDGDIALFNDSRNRLHTGILMQSNGRLYLVHNNLSTGGVAVNLYPHGVSPTLTLKAVYRVADD